MKLSFVLTAVFSILFLGVIPVNAGDITGSGTNKYVPKFTGTYTIGNSTIYQYNNNQLWIGPSGSGQTSSIELGKNASGNRYSYIDLHGDSTYTDFALRLLRMNNGANANSWLEHRGNGSLYLSANDSGSVRVWTNGSTRMTVNSTGNVGINNTTPSYRLDVNGNGRFMTTLVADRTCTGSTSGCDNYCNGSEDLCVSDGGIISDGDLIVGANGYFIGAGEGEVWAVDFETWSPYPESLDVAYSSVLSMKRLPDGQYDPNDTEHQLDHSDLDQFISRESPDGRPGYSITSLLAAQNEVIKDLIKRNNDLESKVEKLQELMGINK
jgi:hypothetical protein